MEKENGQVQPQLYGTSYFFVKIALTGPIIINKEIVLFILIPPLRLFLTILNFKSFLRICKHNLMNYLRIVFFCAFFKAIKKERLRDASFSLSHKIRLDGYIRTLDEKTRTTVYSRCTLRDYL
jgi:hypothetical protein